MKIKSILNLLISIILITSCSKQKPIIGNYYGIFNYDMPQGFSRGAAISITESLKNKIVINGSELLKDGRNIEGVVGYIPNMSSVYIKGEWTHKLFNKNYVIKGTFTETYYQGGIQYQNSGTFEIKSN
jgi:hypothetical protein